MNDFFPADPHLIGQWGQLRLWWLIPSEWGKPQRLKPLFLVWCPESQNMEMFPPCIKEVNMKHILKKGSSVNFCHVSQHNLMNPMTSLLLSISLSSNRHSNPSMLLVSLFRLADPLSFAARFTYHNWITAETLGFQPLYCNFHEISMLPRFPWNISQIHSDPSFCNAGVLEPLGLYKVVPPTYELVYNHHYL